jgi:(E)-4-hydroxy-3-methylbut-2-enyl-diphosphate synthase
VILLGSRKIVDIDGLKIGGGNPVRVESMLKTPLSDLGGCLHETEDLLLCGCELARVALPDMALVENFKQLVAKSKLRLMADIHFNYKLALAAIDAGCRAIRINPGNISCKNGIVDVIRTAQQAGTVIRIGANGGSLNNVQLEKSNHNRATALALAVEEQLQLLLDNDFENIIISAKSTSIPETVRVNSLLSQKYPFPVHIGITEAGGGISGVVKGAVGIGLMLSHGIGDTLRVSLTAPGVEEVKTGYDILRALELRKHGYNFISCPTCGRRRIDVTKLSLQVKEILPNDIPDGITIAVMGCEVNGPREAAGADIGIAGTPDGFVMFKRGKVVCSDTIDKLKEKLLQTIETI